MLSHFSFFPFICKIMIFVASTPLDIFKTACLFNKGMCWAIYDNCKYRCVYVYVYFIYVSHV